MSFCPQCGAPAMPGGAFCSRCGGALGGAPAAASASGAGGTAAPPAYAPPPTHAAAYPPSAAQRPKPTQGMAIVALLLNVLLIPGVGSLVGGRTSAGAWQLGLMACGFLLIFTIIGIIIAIPMFIGAWIWGLVTGIQLVQEAG